MATEKQKQVRKRNFAVFKVRGILKQLELIDNDCSDLCITGSINSIKLHLESLIRRIKDTDYESWKTQKM